MNDEESASSSGGGIVLYGGTFDPIHAGHIALCRTAYEAVHPQRVILIPAHPGYKPLGGLAPDRDRLRMCALAVRNLPYVTVDDLELQSRGPCYTVDTLRAMRERFPEKRLYLLLGTDAFLSFGSWYQWRQCGRMATLLAGIRKQRDRPYLRLQQRCLAQEGITSILLDNPPVPLSSTKIRETIGSGGENVQLDPEVVRYIRARRLYGWKDSVLTGE